MYSCLELIKFCVAVQLKAVLYIEGTIETVIASSKNPAFSLSEVSLGSTSFINGLQIEREE